MSVILLMIEAWVLLVLLWFVAYMHDESNSKFQLEIMKIKM